MDFTYFSLSLSMFLWQSLMYLPIHFGMVLRYSVDFLSVLFSCCWSLFQFVLRCFLQFSSISIALYLFSSLSRVFHFTMSFVHCLPGKMLLFFLIFCIWYVYLMKFLEKRSSNCIDVRALYSFSVPFFFEIFRFRFYFSFLLTLSFSFYKLWLWMVNFFFRVNTVLAWLNATTVIYINV